MRIKLTHCPKYEFNMTKNTENEHRREPRYSCITIPLLYSAQNNSIMKDMGQKLYQAAAVDLSLSGLAFDIDKPLLNGDKILVLLDKPDEYLHEELMTEVRWCRELPSGQYRIGVVIDDSSQPIQKNAVPEINFNAERTAPAEIETFCPACKKKSTFIFVAYQPVLVNKGVMPLYDCSLCGTTRSLTGIIR